MSGGGPFPTSTSGSSSGFFWRSSVLSNTGRTPDGTPDAREEPRTQKEKNTTSWKPPWNTTSPPYHRVFPSPVVLPARGRRRRTLGAWSGPPPGGVWRCVGRRAYRLPYSSTTSHEERGPCVVCIFLVFSGMRMRSIRRAVRGMGLLRIGSKNRHDKSSR